MGVQDIRAIEREAIEYLRGELGERAPEYLALAGEFDEAPLEGEGRTWLFEFDLGGGPTAAAACGAGAAVDPRHYVAIGETTANYFPAYGLSADDAYSFHVGTRFMLGMELQRVDASFEPPGARAALHALLRQFAPGAAVEGEELAALFRCDGDYYAVYRVTVGSQAVYVFGADCPPGFCRLTQHPPQAALRLHLGALIRREARDGGP